MIFRCYTLLCFVLPALLLSIELRAQEEGDSAASVSESAMKIYVVPVQEQISPTTLYAVRNGVKEAIDGEYDMVLLDMDTPGGRLDSTLEIMEVLDRFPGRTATYVNDEAISAGAIISSVTDEIYFTPKAVIGSAEPVTGQGQDINESMKRKLTSYLNAKVEAYTDEYRYRSDVIRAMMDPDFEFKIGEEVISEEGELLNLTAKKAHQEFGDPPEALLGAGIFETREDLIRHISPDTPALVTEFEATWSLELAQVIVSLAPVLLAVAMITVYIEFQTPGFGVFGITGVVCFLVAIFGHNVAGLSGSEPMLLFLLGVVLLALEVFVAPGTLLFAIPGFLLMIGSLLWAMTDIWPEGTEGFEWNWAMFEKPLQNLLGGAFLGIIIILVLARFLPKTFLWKRLVLADTVGGGAAIESENARTAAEASVIGSVGVAVTELRPGGEIEINGKRYDASLAYGSLEQGASVKVVSKSTFGYVVEEVTS